MQYQVIDPQIGFPFAQEAFDLRIVSGDTDSRLDGITFEQAYCLDVIDPIAGGTDFSNAPINTGSLIGSQDPAAASVFEADQIGSNGLSAADNLKAINWILNKDFENNGAGAVDGTFSAWEVQAAIWELTDDFNSAGIFAFDPRLGQSADADFIVAQALSMGSNFEAGVGDKVGLIIDPNPATDDNKQPFIVAIDFESYDCLC